MLFRSAKLAEGEELGSNLLRVVRSSRGCSGGDGASRDWEGGPETAAQAEYRAPGEALQQRVALPSPTPALRASPRHPNGLPRSGFGLSHDVRQIKYRLSQIIDLSGQEQILPSRHRQNGT